jgi:hypothetical protein
MQTDNLFYEEKINFTNSVCQIRGAIYENIGIPITPAIDSVCSEKLPFFVG